MQAIQNFFFKAPVAEAPKLTATKPMNVSSEKELLENVAERINAALINQEMSITFLPEPPQKSAAEQSVEEKLIPQNEASYTTRFGYFENDAPKLPVLSHSFIISTKKTIEPNTATSCNRSIRSNEGQAFYKTEGNYQKWLTPATVDKIDAMIRSKLKEMNPVNDFATKEEISKAIDRKFQDLETRFRNIRKALAEDPLFMPPQRKFWLI